MTPWSFRIYSNILYFFTQTKKPRAGGDAHIGHPTYTRPRQKFSLRPAEPPTFFPSLTGATQRSNGPNDLSMYGPVPTNRVELAPSFQEPRRTVPVYRYQYPLPPFSCELSRVTRPLLIHKLPAKRSGFLLVSAPTKKATWMESTGANVRPTSPSAHFSVDHCPPSSVHWFVPHPHTAHPNLPLMGPSR